ncbi:MAG: anthranilate phosphoribosyltransferase [bacterium]|nr:anthranilate phosphoribosyltransferase [bacterium]
MKNATEILNTLVEKNDLTAVEARQFLIDVMDGAITPVQTAAILTAFRMKGESVAEVRGLIQAMREKMVSMRADDAIDVVGTGGDGSGTFNISTAAAFVASGAGVKIAKHGNRAASSKCGSADVLEALGVRIELTPAQAEEVFKNIGMVFLFAPLYHPSMKQVVLVRRELKIRTIFNVLGPFSNPAGTKRQLVGVPNADLAKELAEVARGLGYTHILIITSDDGMDEASISAKTKVFEISGRSLKKYVIEPAKLGFKKAPVTALRGGNAEENAGIVRAILSGEKGPKRDIVALNAGLALYCAGLARDAKQGIELAEESIDSGKALQALESLVRETQKFAPKS